MPYNVRKTAVDELFMMSLLDKDNKIELEEITLHFDWNSDDTIKKYRSERASLLKKLRIKEKQIQLRPAAREKLRSYGL